MQAFRGTRRLVATAEKEASMTSSLLCRIGEEICQVTTHLCSIWLEFNVTIVRTK